MASFSQMPYRIETASPGGMGGEFSAPPLIWNAPEPLEGWVEVFCAPWLLQNGYEKLEEAEPLESLREALLRAHLTCGE